MLASSRVKQVATLGVVLALGACAPSDEGRSEDEGVTTIAQGLYLKFPKWPTNSSGITTIPVCFDRTVPNTSTHFDQNAIRTRTTVLKSWSAVAKVDFTGWGDCPSNRNGMIVVHLVTVVPPVEGQEAAGSATRGYLGPNVPHPMYLLCDNHPGFGNINEGVTLHEFGHALGFTHETDRPDFTITSCSREPTTGGNFLDTPPNEASSIMATGVCPSNQSVDLSFWDIWGARVAYGARYGAVTQLATAWSASRTEHATVAQFESGSLNSSGYQWSSSEGWLFAKQAPQTVPLQLYWNASRNDFFTTASADGINSAVAAGYTFVRTQGYVYRTQQPGTIPIYTLWNAASQDNLLTSQPGTQMWALANGYSYVRVEGYVFGGYIDPLAGNAVVGSGSMRIMPYIPALWLSNSTTNDHISLGITDVTFPLLSAAADLLFNGHQIRTQVDAAFLRFNVFGTVQAKIFTKNGENVVVATPEAESNFQSQGYSPEHDFLQNGINVSKAYLFTSQYDYDSLSNVIPYQLYSKSATNDNFTTAIAGSWASTNAYTNLGLQGYGLAQAPSPTAFSSPAVSFDSGTQCTVGGITMHCCPNGSVMVGANLGANVFKCGSTAVVGTRVLASLTSSGSTSTCGNLTLFGMTVPTVMVGFHPALNTAACQRTSASASAVATLGLTKYVDRCTYDGTASMRSCPFLPTGSATSHLAGINQSDNTFTCLNPAHYIPAILSGPACNPSGFHFPGLDTYDDGPGNALDGNTDGQFWNGSVTHTTGSGGDYWGVDLGANHVITGVTLFNRTDCCSERLSNFILSHQTAEVPAWVDDFRYTKSTLGVSRLDLNFGYMGLVKVNARYLAIQKPIDDFNPISLAEVQVMGY